MSKYFGQVNFTIEVDSEDEAESIQNDVRAHILKHYGAIVDASADEPVKFDEFGHAG